MCLILVLTALSAVSSPMPAFAQDTGGPPACNSANDGATWTDASGRVWQCQYDPGLGIWVWKKTSQAPNISTMIYGWCGSFCAMNQAYTDRASGGGNTWGNVFSVDLSHDPRNVSAGWLAVAFNLWRWNGSSWQGCQQPGYAYNSGTTWGLGAGANYGLNPPCGSGYYTSSGPGWVWDGGAWRGADLQAGGSIDLFNPTFRASSSFGPAPTIAPPKTPPPPLTPEQARNAPRPKGVTVWEAKAA